MKKRLGKFSLPIRLVYEHPEVVAELTQGMAIVRAEMLYQCNEIEYLALSPLFDVIPDGQMATRYAVTCNLSGGVIANKINRIEV